MSPGLAWLRPLIVTVTAVTVPVRPLTAMLLG
jgi:hypothetical protein